MGYQSDRSYFYSNRFLQAHVALTNLMTSEHDDVKNFVASLAFILSFVSVFLNSALIFIIIRTSILHTSTNVFLVSLSIGELLVALFVTPLAGLAKMSRGMIFSDTLCNLSGSCHCLGSTAAFLSLLMVCIDRCVAIARPLKYSSIIGKCSVVCMVTYVWLHSLVLTLLPFTGSSIYVFDPRYSLCLVLTDLQPTCAYVKGFFGSFLPTFVILCILLKIRKEAKSHHRIFVAIMPSRLYDAPHQRQNVNYSRSTLKALRALHVIVCGYIVFRIPIYIVNIVDETRSRRLSQGLVTSFVWLSFICGAINPAVIIIFNKTFKQKFIETIGMVCIKLLGKGNKELFSVTSGLHSVLEASLVINKLQKNASTAKRHRITLARLAPSFLRSDDRHKVLVRSMSSPSFASTLAGASLVGKDQDMKTLIKVEKSPC